MTLKCVYAAKPLKRELSVGDGAVLLLYCDCRRKKKCIRYSMEEEEHTNKEGVLEIEDEVLVESGGGMAAGGSAEASAVMISQAKASHNSQHAEDELPHLYRHHDIPLTLRTIPT